MTHSDNYDPMYSPEIRFAESYTRVFWSKINTSVHIFLHGRRFGDKGEMKARTASISIPTSSNVDTIRARSCLDHWGKVAL